MFHWLPEGSSEVYTARLSQISPNLPIEYLLDLTMKVLSDPMFDLKNIYLWTFQAPRNRHVAFRVHEGLDFAFRISGLGASLTVMWVFAPAVLRHAPPRDQVGSC